MRGRLLKGFKYISHMFDEGEEELKIGLPTDVKHVAHIGTDGPSQESPSWMKEFEKPEASHSAPLTPFGEPMQNPEVKWVSQDMPKSSRRHLSEGNITVESQEIELTSKPKGSRRHQRKDSSDGSGKPRRPRHQRKDSSEGSSRSGRVAQGGSTHGPEESPSSPVSRKMPGIPKTSRRKKPKDYGLGSTKSKSKNATATVNTTCNAPYSNPGSATDSVTTLVTCNSEYCQTTRLKPEENKGNSGYVS